jgi:hypothetical protein
MVGQGAHYFRARVVTSNLKDGKKPSTDEDHARTALLLTAVLGDFVQYR